MRRAVLFDLDDTLFDHQHCRRAALQRLIADFPAAARFDIPALEALHDKHLQHTHSQLLEGKISVAQARRERIRLLFDEIGIEMPLEEIDRVSLAFRRVYEAARRPVPGAIELLSELRRRGVKVGVVTNGLVATQQSKIAACELGPLLDSVVISEDVGVRKPDPQIFRLALERLGCPGEPAIMVGDSWHYDVLGARNAGLPAVWINRYRGKNPEPETVAEIASLEPLDELLELLLNCPSQHHDPR